VHLARIGRHVDEPSLCHRIEKRVWIAFPFSPERDVDHVESAQVAILRIIQRPPPQALEMPNRRWLADAQDVSQLPRFWMVPEVLMGFDPRH
jgi:hypothetical protein